MRLHNFFIDEPIGDRNTVEISDSGTIHQWRHVLKFNTGTTVVLLDNSGFEYLAQFTELNFRKAVLEIMERRKNKFAPKKELTLFSAQTKSDRFDWLLEKGTELGVFRFAPIISERTTVRKFNIERAKKIFKESSEQSGRGILPVISEPVKLADALVSLDHNLALAFDPSGSPFNDARSTLDTERCSVFIGPEGGFTERELALFREKNIPIASLGTQILRAETAAIAVSALALLQ